MNMPMGQDASAEGGAPDLAGTIEQLKASIAGLSAQVEQVAEAAGIPASGTEGAPAEEPTEMPTEESAEPMEAEEGGESPGAGVPGKGALENFLSKKPKAAM